MNATRVKRNRYGRKGQPWIVECDLCKGGDDFFAAMFASLHPLGWAPTWRIAQDFATKHALAHEATRCTSCLHLPAKPLPARTTANP